MIKKGKKIEVASIEGQVTEMMRTFTLDCPATDAPDSLWKNLGIELNNISTDKSWIGVDNVQLTVN